MTDETSALVDFLRTQLDADEQCAPVQHQDVDEGGYYSCPATRTEPCGDLPYGEDACDCGLDARRRRALAEVESKRRILDEVARIPGDGINFTLSEQSRAEWILQALALPYADREGYRPEWRPS